ncbi:MAG: protein-glutamate O-methyltransferase CheR [Bacteroidota bacterium]|nr:protein-glutamate O-methyltransferase CheR [Bacteroidota bacterium]
MEFTAFSDAIKREMDIDIHGYRGPFITRRLHSRMSLTSCATLEEYYVLLGSDELERGHFLSSLSIPISEFFRDPWLFAHLEHEVFPELLAGKRHSRVRSLRIWSCGCSAGQELYSAALLLCRIQDSRNEPDALQTFLLGTDIDAHALERARSGRYRRGEVGNVALRDIAEYFIPDGEHYRITDRLRGMPRFALHNLLDAAREVPRESVFRAFDLIFCRNVMIYYEPDVQRRMFARLDHMLTSGGYMVMGEFEQPPPEMRATYTRCRENLCLYRKR